LILIYPGQSLALGVRTGVLPEVAGEAGRGAWGYVQHIWKLPAAY